MAARKSRTVQPAERDIDDPEAVRAAIAEQAQQRAKALREFPLSMAAEPASTFRPLVQ